MEKFCENCNATLANQSAGEALLPAIPFTGADRFLKVGLPSVLKSGFTNLAKGFKRTIKDKKRLIVVIALTAVWLAVYLLPARGIFSLPVLVLSFLTAARSGLIGGTIGKGIVAALFSQLVAEKKMIKNLKGGFLKITTVFKGGKNTYAPMLTGAGASLIICNLVTGSTMQNAMIPIAGFLLSVKALTKNGFLRQFFQALPIKKLSENTSFLMQGWAVGFALFIAVSPIPGRWNGYILGILLLLTGIVLLAASKKKGVSA